MTHHPDDYCVWPDGSYATIDEVDNQGAGASMSDDYEIVRADDAKRLIELGLEELAI